MRWGPGRETDEIDKLIIIIQILLTRPAAYRIPANSNAFFK